MTSEDTATHTLEHAGPTQLTAWMSRVTIRLAGDADRAGLAALAALDGALPLRTPVLVAEQDGVLRAARSLHDGAAVSDPFARTAKLLRLLAVHADPGPAASAPGPLARLRGFLSRREALWQRHASGEHLGVSGQDALRALGAPAGLRGR